MHILCCWSRGCLLLFDIHSNKQQLGSLGWLRGPLSPRCMVLISCFSRQWFGSVFIIRRETVLTCGGGGGAASSIPQHRSSDISISRVMDRSGLPPLRLVFWFSSQFRWKPLFCVFWHSSLLVSRRKERNTLSIRLYLARSSAVGYKPLITLH